MQDFQKRRGYKAQLMRMGLGLGGILLLVLVAYFAARGALNMYGKFTQAAAAHEAAELRLTELYVEHERAKERVADLGTARGQEAELRERYGLSRPGEGEIVVVRPQTNDESNTGELGILDKLWRAFFVW